MTFRLRLQRLEQLLKDGAASARSVEEARAQLQVADAALNAARERLAAVREGPVGALGEMVLRLSHPAPYPFSSKRAAYGVIPGSDGSLARPVFP